MQPYFENSSYEHQYTDINTNLRAFYIDYSNRLLGTNHNQEQPSIYLMDLVIQELKTAAGNGSEQAHALLQDIHSSNVIN